MQRVSFYNPPAPFGTVPRNLAPKAQTNFEAFLEGVAAASDVHKIDPVMVGSVEGDTSMFRWDFNDILASEDMLNNGTPDLNKAIGFHEQTHAAQMAEGKWMMFDKLREPEAHSRAMSYVMGEPVEPLYPAYRIDKTISSLWRHRRLLKPFNKSMGLASAFRARPAYSCYSCHGCEDEIKLKPRRIGKTL